jgi:hypothetical protein
MVTSEKRMENLVYLEVIENDKGGHDDLFFQIQGLTERLVFDTYYFALATEPVEELMSVRRFIRTYLETWVSEIKGMEEGDEKVFPIDISDQYVGCMNVRYRGQQVKVTYGYSTMTEGASMDLTSPQKYFTKISDFQQKTPLPLVTDRNALIHSLEHQIEGLNDQGPLFAIHH